MLIGYARVSTLDQSLDSQRNALEAAGCERLFTDHATGRHTARPGLERALEHLRAGDVLVVSRLDRLARSVRDLLDLGSRIEQAGAHLRSLAETIDTTGPGGRFVFVVLGAVAQLEADLARERTLGGLAAARARGRIGGRPRKLSEAQARAALAMLAEGATQSAVAEAFGVHRATLARALERCELHVAT